MSKETKIGIFAIVTIAIGIWSFKYLMGTNLLDTNTLIYAKFKEVDGIRESTPVLFKGYSIGMVTDIYPEDYTYNNIVVEVSIEPNVQINKDAVLQITAMSVMGDKAIMLLNNRPCENNCAQSGDYVRGTNRGLLGSMLGTDDLSNYMAVLTEEFKKLLQTLSTEMKNGSSKIGTALNDFGDAMTNIKQLTGRLDGILATSSSNITGTLANLEALTDTLSTSSSDIKRMIANAEEFTVTLKQTDLDGTLEETKATFTKLQSTLDNADKMVKNLDDLLTKVKSSDGTINMLISNPKFANDLQTTIKGLDLFLQDLRLHPERYRRILSKKTKPYELPDDDPARN